MATIERDYYPLPMAASLIGCTPDDLIHLAAKGTVRLGVILFVDGFATERYAWRGPDDEEKEVVDFCGFAYVDCGYFRHMERDGELAYNRAVLPNGDAVILRMGDIITASIDKVFMHRDDLLPMLAQSTKPLTTTERNSLLTIIAALCDYSAIKYQERGAASQIAKLTEELGAPVSDDSVRRALEKIPSALEARMK